jgi:hypothetical protein
MAVSYTRVSTNPTQCVIGDRVQLCVDITLDASYPTGGYSLAPATTGFSSIDFVDPQLLPVAGAVLFVFNYATQKLMAFTNAGAEVANATDLHLVVGRIQILGKGFASFAGTN